MSLFDELKALADGNGKKEESEKVQELSAEEMKQAAGALADEIYTELVNDLKQNVSAGKFKTVKEKRMAFSEISIQAYGSYKSLTGQHMPTHKTIMGEQDRLFVSEIVKTSKFFSTYISFRTKTTTLGKTLVELLQEKAATDEVTLKVYYTCPVGNGESSEELDYPDFTCLEYSGMAKRNPILHVEANMNI